jgi:6-phosphogluconolactonase
MSPDIIPVDDVAVSFADVVMDQFAARAGERFAIVLSGGPTAAHCYEVLAEEAGGSIDWALVDVYIGDERYVPADDKDSNQKLIRDCLLDGVAPVGSFHPMPTELDIAACASSYASTIGQLLAGPGIDLMHMGLGPDGHTASLFPQAESLQARSDELVVATEDPNGVNPLPRLTLTLPAINQSRHIVFTVDGASKQEAIAQVRSGADIPVNQVRANDMIWLVDHEAAKAP